jgi:hypothetical protein
LRGIAAIGLIVRQLGKDNNAIVVTSAGRSRFLPDVAASSRVRGKRLVRPHVRSGTPPGLMESLLNAAKAAHDEEQSLKRRVSTFRIRTNSRPDIKAQIERFRH